MMRRIAAPLAATAALFLSTAAPALAATPGTFGFAPGSVSATATTEAGSLVTAAGSHPGDLRIQFALNTNSEQRTEGGEPKDFVVDLPPGLIGNPDAMPQCSQEAFDGPSPQCSGSTQVGVLRANVFGLGEVLQPLYNIAPPPRVATLFGFTYAQYSSLQYASVLTDGGYRIEVATPNLPAEVSAVDVTVWGTPAATAHDPDRQCFVPPFGIIHGCSAEAPKAPFLTMPSSCAEPPVFTIKADSKQNPGAFVEEQAPLRDAGGNPYTLDGCQSVPFAPTVAAAPTTQSAESPSGIGFDLSLPNRNLTVSQGIAETEPEKTEVTLPAGVTVNPSAANGIVGCTSAQYESASLDSDGCPEASKVGTLVAHTPLLEEPIEGSVYLAQPHDNEFGSLLALYIVAKAEERGVLVKQAGKVEADPDTGQLTTTFDELPPLPYSSFEFDLREGPRAPLITPQACGDYQTVANLYPFSAPGNPVERTAPFTITSGANGGSCASSESQLTAHPVFEAGTTTPLAGTYSPFLFRVKRSDGEQRFSGVQATLPTGLLGRIAGVPYCSEAGIGTAAARIQEGGGALELAAPSCPSASQVGTVTVSAGAGSQPYYVQGKAYLAGPYKGAPLSLEIVTPAIAGPFDLGSVAVRTALYVDEATAQIHAVSDPLPSILHGIPLDVRTISLQMDKPKFTLNPTNCGSKSVAGLVTTLTGAVAQLSNPFAVGGCKGLAFKPALKLAFLGQTKRLGNPAIKAVLTQPAGSNANIAGATVIVPKGMFIDQAHISNPCTRVQFNAGAVPGEGCPAGSILGTAKVWTPLLDAPEAGKVYFRSNGGDRELPDMVVALQGQIPFQLVGFIDSVGSKGAEVRRVRSRFLGLPDAPVSRFELKLSGGKKGLLENSEDLCKKKNLAKFRLTGQNGATHVTEPAVQVSCGKSGGGKK